MVQDGDHLMLDDSSTSLYIAKHLKEKKNLTVLTYSVEIVMELAGLEGWTILSTGGTLRPDSLAFTGHQVAETLSRYHVDKAILSCKGIDLHAGITDSAVYLQKALEPLRGRISHLSISVECARPRIAPRIPAMRENIARLLGVVPEAVGITATSGEGLTDFGRGLGISVFCILTVEED